MKRVGTSLMRLPMIKSILTIQGLLSNTIRKATTTLIMANEWRDENQTTDEVCKASTTTGFGHGYMKVVAEASFEYLIIFRGKALTRLVPCSEFS
jgi:hypothetical protein